MKHPKHDSLNANAIAFLAVGTHRCHTLCTWMIQSTPLSLASNRTYLGVKVNHIAGYGAYPKWSAQISIRMFLRTACTLYTNAHCVCVDVLMC